MHTFEQIRQAINTTISAGCDSRNRYAIRIPREFEMAMMGDVWQDTPRQDPPLGHFIQSCVMEHGLASILRWEGYLVVWNAAEFGVCRMEDLPQVELVQLVVRLSAESNRAAFQVVSPGLYCCPGCHQCPDKLNGADISTRPSWLP